MRDGRFRALEVYPSGLFGLAGMDLDGEWHAGRGIQEHRLMLEAVGSEDEIGERSVGDDRLAGTAGLSQVDDRGRIFGRSVLVTLEGEVDEQAGRRIAAQRAPFGGVDKALAAAYKIVGQFARMLQKRISLDVDDLELGSIGAPTSAKETTAAATESPRMIQLPKPEYDSNEKPGPRTAGRARATPSH